jgi:hypothetical protein
VARHTKSFKLRGILSNIVTSEPNKTRVRILKSRSEIEAVRQFWNSCRPHRDADFDFYLFFVEANPDTVRPHIVVLYEGEVPKALLVGRIDAGYVSLKLGYFALPTPKMKILQIVHGGWLGDISEVNAEVLVRSIIESLRLGEADAAMLHYVNLNSTLAHQARFLPSQIYSDHFLKPEIHRWHKFSGADRGFLAGLSQNERYQQRKRERKIEKTFRDRKIERFTRIEDVDRVICDAETVARKSYQRGIGVGFSQSSMIRSRLEFEAQKGWLCAYVLYLDCNPCAFWIGSLRDGTFLSDYLAFDPTYAKYAPGMYLMMKVMDELRGDPPNGLVARIDFGTGDASYKERLGNGSSEQSLVYIFAPSIKGVLVNGLRSMIGLVDRLIRRLNWLAPIAKRIKRFWRGRMIVSGDQQAQTGE